VKVVPLQFTKQGGKSSSLVAIKVPKDPDKDFLKELAVWLSLNHPNIVKLLDYDINPRPYIVMELMNGSLHGRVIQGSIAISICFYRMKVT